MADDIALRVAESGMVFSATMPTNQREFYNARSGFYDSQMAIPKRVARQVIINGFYHDNLSKFIGITPISYLDAACGTGTATAQFVKGLESYAKLKEIFAIDISDEMVKLASGNLPSFQVMQGDMANLPFNDKFGLITILFHGLGHLSDESLRACFESMKKSLKPGGYACFDVIKRFSVGEQGYTVEDERAGRNFLCYRTLGPDGKILTDGKSNILIGTDRLFTVEEMEHLAKSSGLEVAALREFRITNPDPKVGHLNEIAAIVKKK